MAGALAARWCSRGEAVLPRGSKRRYATPGTVPYLSLTTSSNVPSTGTELTSKKPSTNVSSQPKERADIAILRAINGIFDAQHAHVTKQKKGGTGISPTPVKITCDSQGAQAFAKRPMNHQRTKHIAVRWHFVRDAITQEKVKILDGGTEDMVADGLTKGMLRPAHEKHTGQMGVVVAVEASPPKTLEIVVRPKANESASEPARNGAQCADNVLRDKDEQFALIETVNTARRICLLPAHRDMFARNVGSEDDVDWARSRQSRGGISEKICRSR
ncbi:MAG: hypothetical protein BJ554DRAFT_7197 [Olpidium bornovanus]|uniref:Uncharacterized protein n=1 Tax=Olpidium bornovanus TaxID=278681 RepID=A0A8H8DJM6_9FUNG|nr:MAG: hypothetical protein BJ554DRAFT_7197 [Olpidium bornovanus]